MQQCRGMDELHNGGERVVRGSTVAQRARGQQHQRRTQALAAAADDVLRNLPDKGHFRMQRSRMTRSTARMSAESSWLRFSRNTVRGKRRMIATSGVPGVRPHLRPPPMTGVTD